MALRYTVLMPPQGLNDSLTLFLLCGLPIKVNNGFVNTSLRGFFLVEEDFKSARS